MKIAKITDTHFGVRGDSQIFYGHFKRFYHELFFPYLDDNGIDTVFMLGDTFDRRKYTNHVTLDFAKEIFFDELARRNIDVHMIIGNHDTAYKNTNKVNSPELFLPEYTNITMYSSPKTIELKDGTQIAMLPWICPDNFEECMEFIEDTPAQILFGHLELAGFEMYRGAVIDHGFDYKLFKKFEQVYSGHYHHKSTKGNITYLGAPYEMNWQDYNDPRGFHIFDTQTRESTHIQNPFTLFHKIRYNDKNKSMTDILNFDFSKTKGTYIKVVVEEKKEPYWFDLFMERLQQAEPHDVQVIDSVMLLEETTPNDVLDEAEDTLTIINKYLSQNISTEMNDDKVLSLEKLLAELYEEALTVEHTSE